MLCNTIVTRIFLSFIRFDYEKDIGYTAINHGVAIGNGVVCRRIGPGSPYRCRKSG